MDNKEFHDLMMKLRKEEIFLRMEHDPEKKENLINNIEEQNRVKKEYAKYITEKIEKERIENDQYQRR